MSDNSQPKIQVNDLSLDRITYKIVELFGQKLGEQIGQPLAIAEVVSYIVSDWTKIFYNNNSG